MAALAVRHLTVMLHQKPVIWDVSLTVPTGVLGAIVGPNGAGKTTFLKAVLQLVHPFAGTVFWLGKKYAEKRHAIAYVPQRMSVDWNFPASVLDIVLMGRYMPHRWFWRPNKEDIRCAHETIAQVGLEQYTHSPIGELSGGQQQRVFLARALAQDPLIFCMDEPFTGVDAVTEQMMIDLFKTLCARGKTVIMVHHDLQTVPLYFDWLALLNKSCIASGPISTVFTQEYIAAAYGNCFFSSFSQ
ncbi:MAG TPA: metal ABC transporter ATP-binding protein, partial [Candidatus Bathyarchaeia archaeon]|nr:metal ABC transporter ATP-binding protein [Candidatus Bathyarchaeia archaeon]